MTENERDIAALQGDWVQVSLEADGVIDPPDTYGVDLCTTFTGDRFRVHAPDGTVVLAGSFTLDAATTPRSITWTDAMGEDAGKSLLAIYELAGDSFVFVAASPGDPRPTTFRTTHGQTLRRFVRR